ncbi:MAG: cation transporter [Candidatus Heimdallarchaeota archaeon]|nr:cation transporter [Candidatus Heimdallarchaeota archaeon]MCK4290480.1 cation transporter [Candidatus Heimdallarchaeota archaeon]
MSKLGTAVKNNSITDRNDRLIKARNITIIGLIINVLLAVFKITISIRSGSLSLLADGLDSALDIATVIFGFVAIRIANRPPDKDHHFGHAKFENFFSLGIALLLVASSGIIGYQAITKLIDNTLSVYDPYNLIIAAISIVLKGLLVWLNISVGKKIKSPILVANGKNFRTDILTSIVVLISVSIGHRSIGSFSLFWVDPIIAIIISVIIIITAIGIVKDSAGVLLDESPNEETMLKIEEYTKEQAGVKEIGNIRARSIGANIFLVDLDIYLDPTLTIDEGHDIACIVEEVLKEKLPIKYIQIHVEPYHIIHEQEKNELEEK